MCWNQTRRLAASGAAAQTAIAVVVTFTPCFAPVHHRSERASFDAENPAPGILVVTVAGYGDDDVAGLLVDCVERMVSTFGTYEAFHDWSGMTGYSTSARVRLTELVRKQRTKVSLFFENRIIAMGVSVASLAVPTLTSFNDRRAFEAARDAAIAAARREGPTAGLRPAQRPAR